MSKMVLELNEKSFKGELSKSTPIIIDFWAPWCGPCKMLAPVFEKLATSKEFEGKLRFAKVNVDDNSSVASDYNVRGIPCLIIFSSSKEIDRITGFGNEAILKTKIADILGKIKKY